MTEVIFGDLDSEEDFYKSLKAIVSPPDLTDIPGQSRSKTWMDACMEQWMNVDYSTRLIDVRADGSWLLLLRLGNVYKFENKTWNETKRELSFTLKVTQNWTVKKFIDETNNDAWDDLTRVEWRKIDDLFDDMPCSIEIPKFSWHIPSAKDKEARVAYIEANGRKPPRSLAPPEEVEKPEPTAAPPRTTPPLAALNFFAAPPLASSPLFDRRRPPPELPPRRTPSQRRKTRTSLKAAAAVVAVDDD